MSGIGFADEGLSNNLNEYKDLLNKQMLEEARCLINGQNFDDELAKERMKHQFESQFCKETAKQDEISKVPTITFVNQENGQKTKVNADEYSKPQSLRPP